jgi:UDP-glucose 4-epimerase
MLFMPISLVIGGAGFVGSHLVDTLLARSRRVRVLDDFSSGTPTNLPHDNPRLEIIRGDINDLEAVSRATEGAAYVFHLATPSHGSCARSMSADRWAYTTDTLNVLAAAHKAGVKRLIYSSCESVYGPAVAKPLTETDPTLPLSPYAFTKLTGEQQCIAFSAMFGMETVRLRYFNVFGPRQVSSGARPPAIHQILTTMLSGQNPKIAGEGDEPQDFIYVDDVVHANLLAAEAPRVSGKVYNIARGRPTTLNAVVATINSLLGSNLQPCHDGDRATEWGSRLTNIARAEVELGFCPGTDLEEGLRRCIAYYKARPEELQVPRFESQLDGPHFLRRAPDSLASHDDDGGSSCTCQDRCN